jgi:hypothetical protein
MEKIDGKIVFKLKSVETVDIDCELHHEEGIPLNEHEKEHCKMVEKIKNIMIDHGLYNRREGDNFVREKVIESELSEIKNIYEKNNEFNEA